MTTVTLHLHGALARNALAGDAPAGDMVAGDSPAMTFALDRPLAIIAAAAAQRPSLDSALRRGWFVLGAGAARTPLAGVDLDRPVGEADLHLMPARAGAARGEGKMLLGLTLLGLSFVPGVQTGITSGLSAVGEGIAGAGGAEIGGMLGSRLLGGAAAWLILSGAAEALSPQVRRPAGDAASTGIVPSAPTGEGAAIPLVYGRVRMTAPPIVSAGLSVQAMRP